MDGNVIVSLRATMHGVDWSLTAQMVGAIAAALAAGAAWRSALLSGRAIESSRRQQVQRTEHRLALLRAELTKALA